MTVKLLKETFCICKLPDISQVDLQDKFCFLSLTDEEISLVCEQSKLPANATDVQRDFRGFRLDGVLDFSLVGILSSICALLARENISLFALSTFNTDYFLVRSEHFERAVAALHLHGHKTHED